MIQKTKKSFVLLMTTFLIFFMLLAIGTFIKYSTNITSKEFHKDLAKIRGYWAVYGAKELNSSFVYPYYRLDSNKTLYDINASKDTNVTVGNIYFWTIINDSSSGIKNNDIFRRDLNATDSNTTNSYIYNPQR